MTFALPLINPGCCGGGGGGGTEAEAEAEVEARGGDAYAVASAGKAWSRRERSWNGRARAADCISAPLSAVNTPELNTISITCSLTVSSAAWSLLRRRLSSSSFLSRPPLNASLDETRWSEHADSERVVIGVGAKLRNDIGVDTDPAQEKPSSIERQQGSRFSFSTDTQALH